MRAWIVTIAVAAGALLGAQAALADQGDSSNWAGYAVHGARFLRVRASWRQPAVACVPGHATFSAYWVGLGGYSGNALEQIGTEADCTADGRSIMSAWYEMVPAASVAVPMAIAPGDRMQAAVSVRGHEAMLVLRDLTRHHDFRTTVSSSAIDVTSAEWIVEAPSDCLSTCATLPLADFGSASFTQARAEDASGRWGPVSAPRWRATAIRLLPGARVAAAGPARAAVAAVPSALTAGGQAFAVNYVSVSGAPTLGRRRPATVRELALAHPVRRG